jgi:hypothetical protein
MRSSYLDILLQGFSLFLYFVLSCEKIQSAETGRGNIGRTVERQPLSEGVISPKGPFGIDKLEDLGTLIQMSAFYSSGDISPPGLHSLSIFTPSEPFQ